MSIVAIRAALQKQLDSITPIIDTAHENERLIPRPGQPYQRTTLLPAETVNPSFGGGLHRESGIFQVMLCYQDKKGAGEADARAEVVRAAFSRGASFVQAGVTVQIDKTPTVGTAIIDGDRYCVPVRVRYFANVFS